MNPSPVTAVPEEVELLDAAEQPGPGMAIRDYLIGLAGRMLVLFGFYVLSIGPLYWKWYSSKFVNGSPYIAAFYEPLWVLAHRVPWFGDWLDFYVQLWNGWQI